MFLLALDFWSRTSTFEQPGRLATVAGTAFGDERGFRDECADPLLKLTVGRVVSFTWTPPRPTKCLTYWYFSVI
jgi:hypothetical protein